MSRETLCPLLLGFHIVLGWGPCWNLKYLMIFHIWGHYDLHRLNTSIRKNIVRLFSWFCALLKKNPQIQKMVMPPSFLPLRWKVNTTFSRHWRPSQMLGCSFDALFTLTDSSLYTSCVQVQLCNEYSIAEEGEQEAGRHLEAVPYSGYNLAYLPSSFGEHTRRQARMCQF